VTNPPFQQRLKLVAPNHEHYTVSIEQSRSPKTYPVSTDGTITLDVPSMSRGCDVYWTAEKRGRSAANRSAAEFPERIARRLEDF
jgi:hypothetical protein